MAVQETRNLPAQFVEDLGKDLAEQVTAQSGVPVVTTGLAGLGSMAQPTKQQQHRLPFTIKRGVWCLDNIAKGCLNSYKRCKTQRSSSQPSSSHVLAQ